MKKYIVLLFLSCLIAGCAFGNQSPTTEFVAEPTVLQTNIDKTIAVPSSTPEPSVITSSGDEPDLVLDTDAFYKEIVQVGGSVSGLVFIEDVAYVGIGPRVAKMSFNQQGEIQLDKFSDPLPGRVTNLIKLVDRSAGHMVISAGKYLVIMDLLDKATLSMKCQLEMPGEISSLVLDLASPILYVGGAIYHSATDYSGFISAVRLSENVCLELISSTDMPEQPLSLTIGEKGLFAGTEGYQGGLYYMQVNKPGELSSVDLVIPSTPEAPFQPLCLKVFDNRLYASYRSVRAFDISTPMHPVLIWEANVGGNVVKSFSIAKERIFFYGWTITSELVYDSFVPPEPVTGALIGEISQVTVLYDGLFIVADHTLKSFDIVDPEKFSLVDEFQPPLSNVVSAVSNSEKIFAIDLGLGDGRGFAVLEVLGLPELTPLARVETELLNNISLFQGIEIKHDRLFLASSEIVWVYDVNQSDPELISKLEIGGGDIDALKALQFADKDLFFVSQQSSESSTFSIYDLTNLQTPVMLGDPITVQKGEIIQVSITESDVYALIKPIYEIDFAILHVLGVDGDRLWIKESYQIPGYITDMAVNNSIIAITSMDKLMVFKVNREGLPELTSQTDLGANGFGVGIAKNDLLVIVGTKRGPANVLVFDNLDEGRIEQIESIDVAESGLSELNVLMTESYLALPNGISGILEIQFNP